MAAARAFPDMLSQFLTIYLPITRACSPNTVAAYRDAFTLFLRFMDQQRATPPDRVAFADFTTSTVAAFLGWLRTDRQSSTTTVNHRLAALKSFFRYVQAHAPEQIAQAGTSWQPRPPKPPSRPSATFPSKRSGCCSNTPPVAGTATWLC